MKPYTVVVVYLDTHEVAVQHARADRAEDVTVINPRGSAYIMAGVFDGHISSLYND